MKSKSKTTLSPSQIAALLGSLGGSSKSKAKQDAARENGKKPKLKRAGKLIDKGSADKMQIPANNP